MDEEDVIGRSEAALKDVGEMWDRLEGAKVEMKEHDYHVGELSFIGRYGADLVGRCALCADR